MSSSAISRPFLSSIAAAAARAASMASDVALMAQTLRLGTANLRCRRPYRSA